MNQQQAPILCMHYDVVCYT